jgi:hypothetical protein
VPDTDPGPSTRIALAKTIPAPGLAHIRHLNYSWGPNPKYPAGFHTGVSKGIVVGLKQETSGALQHAILALESVRKDDVPMARLHAEHVVNYIVGGKGEDADGDGKVANLGDGGPGIILGADKVGYASDAAKHAMLAMDVAPNELAIKRHGPEVVAGANNAEAWATAALEEARRAAALSDRILIEDRLNLLITQLNRTFYGFNANQDLEISRTAEEAGVMQAYEAAQDMGAYVLMVPPAAARPPQVGDPILARLPLYALALGVVLLVGGGLIYWRSRQVPS